MRLAIAVVDAFADAPFAGNPAAVCLLKQQEVAEVVMQKVALEMNHAETAFVAAPGTWFGEAEATFDLRWFTPMAEVDLCGHATLAAAHRIWELGVVDPSRKIAFATRSGLLHAERSGKDVVLSFPAEPVDECSLPFPSETLHRAVFCGKNRMDWLLEMPCEGDVRKIDANSDDIRRMGMRGVIVTASSAGPYDCVCRFFGPNVGVVEDYVTGSAHCALGPYWSAKLGRQTIVSRQISLRPGTVRVTTFGAKVALAGSAVTVLEGSLCY